MSENTPKTRMILTIFETGISVNFRSWKTAKSHGKGKGLRVRTLTGQVVRFVIKAPRNLARLLCSTKQSFCDRGPSKIGAQKLVLCMFPNGRK